MNFSKASLSLFLVAFPMAHAGAAEQPSLTIAGSDLPGRPMDPSADKHSFLCSAICGNVQTTADSRQGIVIIQLLAAGASRDEAFASLKKKCESVSDQVQKIPQPDGHIPAALDLMFGYTVANDDVGLRGGSFPATANNVCILF